MSGGSKSKSTTKVVLAPEQRKTLGMAMPFLENFAENPPSPPTDSIYPGFNPTQQQAQQSALSAAGDMKGTAQGAQGAADFMLGGDVLDPSTNPHLQSYMDAAVAPIFDSLTEQVLPNLRSEFVGAGQYGGSRQGIAEGLASKGASRAAGETTSRIASDAYQSGLDAMTRSMAISPSIQGMHLAPSQAESAVGDTRYALQQAQQEEAVQQQQMADFWDLILGQELLSSAGMIPGGSTVSTQKTPGPGLFSTILGGLGTAVGLGMGGPIGGALGGAASNALTPLFGFL